MKTESVYAAAMRISQKPLCSCGDLYTKHVDGFVVGLGLACTARIKVGDDAYIICQCDDYSPEKPG